MIQPNLIIYPFAVDGDIVPIPTDGTQESNFTSQKIGFPETMSEDVNVPRSEMNGVFNLYSQVILFINTGGFYTFDPLYTDGYKNGAVLFCFLPEFKGFLISNKDSNTSNFLTDFNAFVGDDTKPWSKITSYLPDITDVDGEITFNGNTHTTGIANFNMLKAIDANFINRPIITSLPSEDIIINGETHKSNEVAVLGDLQSSSDVRCNVDQGFGGQITDTGYNSDTFPGIKDGGSIGKWANIDVVFSEFANSAVCQVVCKCASFAVINGYGDLTGRDYQITNASNYLTSFGLTFGEFFPLAQTFLSTSGVSITYDGTNINLHVDGGNCSEIRQTYLKFISVVVSPEVLLKRELAAQLTQHLGAEILMIDNDLSSINYIKNGDLFNFNSLKNQSKFLMSIENYNNVGVINKIKNGEIVLNKKVNKKTLNEIEKRLKSNEKFDMWNEYLN